MSRSSASISAGVTRPPPLAWSPISQSVTCSQNRCSLGKSGSSISVVWNVPASRFVGHARNGGSSVPCEFMAHFVSNLLQIVAVLSDSGSLSRLVLWRMERTPLPAQAAISAAAADAYRPRRRWSDGPNYPWSAAGGEGAGVAAQWPAVAALLCEQVTSNTNSLWQEIERLRADGRLSGTEAGTIQRCVESMRAASSTVQKVVRLGAGLVQPKVARVDLTGLARQIVQERQTELVRRRAEVALDIRPAEVLLDEPLAAELISSALDWALSFSSKIRLKIEVPSLTEPVRLVVRGTLAQPSAPPAQPATSRRAERRGERRMNDNLHWFLLLQLATCSRLGVSRSSTAGTESAVIEFPKELVATSAVSMVELLPGGQAESQLRGSWVLAVVRDRSLREQVLRLMLRNGLECSVAENCEQARQLCVSRLPQVLVSCPDSLGATLLRKELADDRPCALIQIVRGSPSFAASGFAGYESAKVSRERLAQELIPALLFELAQQAES